MFQAFIFYFPPNLPPTASDESKIADERKTPKLWLEHEESKHEREMAEILSDTNLLHYTRIA